jgi:hypothetical protein
MIFHCDKGQTIEKFDITDQGFLKLVGTVAHVGYLSYTRKDGGIDKEYVPVETLFAPEHINSTETAVITLNHPPQGISVSPRFWSYNKGSVKNTIKNDEQKTLMVEMIVGSEDAILAIQQGITCLSMGYSVERKQTGENSYIQTKRICNHIAIVEKGRASKARIHLDSFEKLNIDSKLNDFMEVIYPIRLTKITL